MKHFKTLQLCQEKKRNVHEFANTVGRFFFISTLLNIGRQSQRGYTCLEGRRTDNNEDGDVAIFAEKIKN
jgi:hypothetical protein